MKFQPEPKPHRIAPPPWALDFGRSQIAWLIVAAALAFGDSAALAVTRVVSTLPGTGKPTKTGLMLQIDTNWVDTDGYRPVSVTAKCTPPPIGDRTLTITLKTDGYGLESYAVSANLELPAGTSAANIVIPVPQFGNGFVLSVTTTEDGRKIDELSADYFTPFSNQPGIGEAALLHVSEASPPVDLEAFFGKLTQTPGAQTTQQLLIDRTVAEMPQEWLDLTALDFVTMSCDELALMAQAAPRAWRAVRDWTAAGGNLCIYDAGERFERLVDIDGLLGDRLPAAAGDVGPGDDAWADCDSALLTDLNATAFDPMVVADELLEDDPAPPQDLGTLKKFAARQAAQGGRPFRWRAFRLGRVVAWTASDPFPATTDPALSDRLNEWHWIRATLGPTRYSWAQRHGISFGGGNHDFWNLMIPGVGLPPVNAYRVLITLFVISIGPVNYFLLRRLRRLHFLLFIVPASAALVTAALLSYALICDGLGTRLRARSFTLLDQRSGQAVSWCALVVLCRPGPLRRTDVPARHRGLSLRI